MSKNNTGMAALSADLPVIRKYFNYNSGDDWSWTEHYSYRYVQVWSEADFKEGFLSGDDKSDFKVWTPSEKVGITITPFTCVSIVVSVLPSSAAK